VSEIRRQLRRALADLSQNVSSTQRLVQSLRNEVTRARMVPVGRLFERFPRQVLETARLAGKTVVLKMGGTGVEVDSAIIEQLADPLLHLVQNAIIHGLETEDERRAAGKPVDGTLHLRAAHDGGAVLIEVEDDGRGIDVEGLRTHATEQGLIDPYTASQLSEHEIVNLIFLPGVTTASEVTTVSGRGLGLDVVRTNVARVNGDVEVTTQRGVGTRFRIKIPLTVLIVDALVVGAGGETFAVPLNKISHVATVAPERIQSAGDKQLVWVRDQLVDLVRLDRVLALPAVATPRDIPLLVVRAEGRLVALAVADVRGKEEIVIKGLGGFPDGLGPFSSGTICADGRVMLVLNLARLLQMSNPPSASEVRGRLVPSGPPSAAQRPLAKANRRFLLVDDSISVRKFVGQMLERSGFDVVTASNGIEALQQVENTAIHAVITDLEMPNGHGYELIETLRRRPSTRNLPIVILTTRSGDKHHDLARRLGVDHYLTKPVDEAAFTALMGSLVGQPGAAATGPDGT
jgi:chemosensory pili system protein ChpA (sensor histidine kinase/response regulator)